MIIPETIDLKVITFPAYYVAVFVLGLITLFVIWWESVKDGFDKEKVFDVYFLSVAYLIGLHFLIRYLSFYYYQIEQNQGFVLASSFVTGTLIAYKMLTKKWKWSVYRFLDIFSFLFFSLSVVVFFSQAYLAKDTSSYIYLSAYAVAFLVAYYTRNKTFSGATFSAFLLLAALMGQNFFMSNTYLIFYISLITISIVNLFIRSKQKMANNKLKFELMAKIKGLLLSKDKRLKDEQQKLIEEDPYLQEGRDTGNAEEIDEAILEDRAKTEIDIKKKSIGFMQEQVRRALGKMEKGEYGICEVCGQEIDKARLEVYPEATKCLKCANLESAKS